MSGSTQKLRKMFPPEKRGWVPCRLCRELFYQRQTSWNWPKFVFCSTTCCQNWMAIHAKVYVPCRICQRPLTKKQRWQGKVHCSTACRRVTEKRRRRGMQLVKWAAAARANAIAKWAPELSTYFDAHRTAGQGNIYAKVEPGIWKKMPEEFRNVKRTPLNKRVAFEEMQ